MKKAFYTGLVSSVASGLVFVIFRLTLMVLTPPEVLVDFVVRIMPLNLFLLAVGNLGSWAKVLLVIGLALVLIVSGGFLGMLYVWLDKRWGWLGRTGKGWVATLWGLLLWVLDMAVILPISGKGFFSLLTQPWPVALVLVWLLGAFIYAFTFVGLFSRPEATNEQPEESGVSRRSFLKSLIYVGGGLLVAGGIGVAVWRMIVSARRSILGPARCRRKSPPTKISMQCQKISSTLWWMPLPGSWK
jgi:hypothetical protein